MASASSNLSLAALVGNFCLDTVLPAPSFPREDTDTRVSGASVVPGGNAASTALLAAKLIGCVSAEPLLADLCTVLPRSGNDSEADETIAHIERDLGVRIRHSSVTVEDLNCKLPHSYVILARDTGSRTILHSRDPRFRELEPKDALYERLFGKEAGNPQYLHLEGRAPAAMLDLLRPLAMTDQSCLVTLEVEKERKVDAPLKSICDLIPLCDLAVVSKDFAMQRMGKEDGNGADSEKTSPLASLKLLTSLEAPPGISMGTRLAGPRVAILLPWGSEGVYLACRAPGTAATITTTDGPPPWTCYHIPGRMPSSGKVVDTLGAGDAFNGALAAAALLISAKLVLPPTSLTAFVEGEEGGESIAAVLGKKDCDSSLFAPLVLALAAYANYIASEKCGWPPAAAVSDDGAGVGGVYGFVTGHSAEQTKELHQKALDAAVHAATNIPEYVCTC
jgi:sugar/nucleoside kinase (ribokinase family)